MKLIHYVASVMGTGKWAMVGASHSVVAPNPYIAVKAAKDYFVAEFTRSNPGEVRERNSHSDNLLEI